MQAVTNVLPVLAILVVLSSSAAVRAQPAAPSTESRAAGALFDQGRQFLAAHRYADACAAFEESQQLDPQLGTLFNLATCNVHIGKLATAWKQFHDIAQRDANRARRASAAKQAAALVRRLPRLVIKLEPAIADATVTSNGVDIGAALGIGGPVDLGEYEIVASAPGFAESRDTAKVTDEGKTVVVSIALDRAPEPANAAPPKQPAVPAPITASKDAPPVASSDEPAPADQSPAGRRKTLGLLTLAGGGALLAGGLVLGKLASDKWSDARGVCPEAGCANAADLARAQSLTSDARLRGNLATGIVVAGAVAAGIGAYLWLRAPSAPSMSARLVPHIAPTGVAVVLEGRL